MRSSRVLQQTLQLLVAAEAQHVEDCPAAHEGGLKGSGGAGRELYPSQYIYSYSCPCLWCHLPLQSSILLACLQEK